MEQQYILLPQSGIRASTVQEANILQNLPSVRSTEQSESAVIASANNANVEVIDTINEDGPKLVELTAEAAALINRPSSPVRAIPIVVYDHPNPIIYPLASSAVLPAVPPITFEVECTNRVTGVPLADCNVIAFDNFATRSGSQGQTNAQGRVLLSLAANKIDRLYVYAPDGYWGGFRSNLAVVAGARIPVPIEPIDLAYTDAVRHYYGNSNFNATTGVTVGVIDTGVGPHSDLNIVSRTNTVTGEPASQGQDPHGHGTHVAGLIGSYGLPPTGLRGMAPNVNLRGYRVFPGNDGGATNYAILKALIFAANDGCDIVNLSLGGGPFDSIVEEAIQDARDHGMLVIIAAGNDGRRAVSYPAKHVGATAISALGTVGTFPAGSLPEGDILFPPRASAYPNEFIAGFSNVGVEIALAAPGVGVLSTMPNNGFAQMSGTSMAAPVAAGAAACLLSRNPAIYGMTRNAARSAAIERLLQSNCILRGFGNIYEGYGLPDPTTI